MNNNITENYEGHLFKVEFIVSYPLKHNSRGKSWAKCTQCVIYDNQRIMGFGECIKHSNDKDDNKYAKVYSAKKAFKQTRLWKEIRQRLWQKILLTQ